MLPEIERVLLTNWEAFGLCGKRPERFFYILSTEEHWHSKVTLYCLPRRNPAHTVVVKIQRAHLRLPFLETEHRQLQALQADERLQDLRSSVPRPLFFGEVAGHPVLVETCMPGVSFSKHAQRRRPELFLRASKWLGLFHGRTLRAARPLTAEERNEYLLRPTELAIQASRGHRALQHFLNRIARRVEDLAGVAIPVVFNHNDLCLSNVRFQGEQVQVIDWEFSRDHGLPLLDLLNLFLFFAMGWKRIAYSNAFRLAFSRGNELSGLLQRCLRDYFRRLGVSPALLSLLAVQYLISRLPLLHSVGNAAGVEETLWCLESLAEREGELEIWGDGGARGLAPA